MIDQARKPILSGVCERVCRALAAVPLLDADLVLDDARRFAIARIFFGHPDESIAEDLHTTAAAREMAQHYRDLSALEIVWIDGQVRLHLWAANCASIPATRYGALYKATLERAAAGDDAKLN
jgi:hypothetical protein